MNSVSQMLMVTKPKWNKEVPCTNVSCCSNPFCPKLHRLSRTTTKGRARPSFDPAKHNAAKAMAQGSQDPYPPATWLAWAVDTAGMTMHWSGVPWTCSGKLGRLRSGRNWMEITFVKNYVLFDVDSGCVRSQRKRSLVLARSFKVESSSHSL